MASIPKNGQADGISSLRRFGLAVARDCRFFVDERQTRPLVEALCNRALLAAHNGDGPRDADLRVRLYALFIRFLRRHMRQAAIDDGAGEPTASPTVSEARESLIARAMRRLPLELREALLLVALEGLSHREAAQALDISLATLIDRLARARAALTAGLSGEVAAPVLHSLRGHRPYLRLVK